MDYRRDLVLYIFCSVDNTLSLVTAEIDTHGHTPRRSDTDYGFQETTYTPTYTVPHPEKRLHRYADDGDGGRNEERRARAVVYFESRIKLSEALYIFYNISEIRENILSRITISIMSNSYIIQMLDRQLKFM